MDLSKFYLSFSKISKVIKYDDLNFINKNLEINNSSNDSVKRMDMIAHNLIVESLESNNNIVGYISEESEDVVFTKEFKNDNNYIMAFDPIDGSTNVLSNITVGTIYCLYKYDKNKNRIEKIIEAGYCLYGPRVTLVKTEGDKVEQFALSKDNIFIKENDLSFNFNNEKIYSINESNRFSTEIRDLLNFYKSNNYNQRWVGSMVADCHQILCKGGIFMYPISEKYPQGKLRLLYEVIPFSFIFKAAGGIGIDSNYDSILDKHYTYDLSKDDLHKPIGVILCSHKEYQNLLNYLEIRENIFC